MVEIFEAIAKTTDQYGPVIVLLSGLVILNAFYVWRDYRRESQQRAEIETLWKTHDETIIPMMGECKEAIASCKEVINQNSTIISSWLHHGR